MKVISYKEYCQEVKNIRKMRGGDMVEVSLDETDGKIILEVNFAALGYISPEEVEDYANHIIEAVRIAKTSPLQHCKVEW